MKLKNGIAIAIVSGILCGACEKAESPYVGSDEALSVAEMINPHWSYVVVKANNNLFFYRDSVSQVSQLTRSSDEEKRDLVLSPDGKWAAYLDSAGVPVMVATEYPHKTKRFPSVRDARHLHWLPDGSGLYTAYPDGNIRFTENKWIVPDIASVVESDTNQRMLDFVFLPDGNGVISCLSLDTVLEEWVTHVIRISIEDNSLDTIPSYQHLNEPVNHLQSNKEGEIVMYTATGVILDSIIIEGPREQGYLLQLSPDKTYPQALRFGRGRVVSSAGARFIATVLEGSEAVVRIDNLTAEDYSVLVADQRVLLPFSFEIQDFDIQMPSSAFPPPFGE